MISDSKIQEIQNAIDIVDIIGGFLNLKRRGANLLGLCPFHDEKTPSFTVSPAKGIYKCFGCGASGNAITFLMQHEKFSFVEALRWLATKYNIDLPESNWTGDQSKASSLHIVNEFAAKYFFEHWTKAESYLSVRGISPASIEKFSIGFDDGGFASLARQKQFSGDILKLSGLVNDNGQDNYRGRLIFPVHSASGKIIGFGARKLTEGDYGPKYLNTPDNDAYNKSNVLYGLYQAARTITKLNECILVEGYTDVISLHQGGISNVVASSGTSLTTGQVRLIKKYTNHLTVLYDGDAAGNKATLRGMDLALDEGLRIKVVILPAGEDPDSYIKKVGAERFMGYLHNNTNDFIVTMLDLLLKNVNDAVEKNDVVKQIAISIAKLSRAEDFTLRNDYIRQCSQLLGIDELGLITLVNSHSTGGQPVASPPTLPTNGNEAEKNIVRVLLEHGDKAYGAATVGQYILREFEENDLLSLMDNPQYSSVITCYSGLNEEGVLPVQNDFLYNANTDISSLSAELLSTTSNLSAGWTEFFKGTIDHDKLYIKEVESTMAYLKLQKIKKLIKKNQEDLKTETDPDLQTNYVKAHQHLKKIEMELSQYLGAVIVKK